MISSILVPIDGSGHANRAVGFAIELASRFDARLVLMHVASDDLPGELAEFAEAEGLKGPEVPRIVAERILDAAEDRARDADVTEVDRVLAGGDPAKAILEAADARGVDLIVMGSRGLSPLGERALGSVSHEINTHAKCITAIVR